MRAARACRTVSCDIDNPPGDSCLLSPSPLSSSLCPMQLTDKVWSWLNSAFMDQIPSMGVHLGPDHIDTVGTAEPSEAAMSDRSLAGNASLHTGDEDTLDCKVPHSPFLPRRPCQRVHTRAYWCWTVMCWDKQQTNRGLAALFQLRGQYPMAAWYRSRGWLQLHSVIFSSEAACSSHAPASAHREHRTEGRDSDAPGGLSGKHRVARKRPDFDTLMSVATAHRSRPGTHPTESPLLPTPTISRSCRRGWVNGGHFLGDSDCGRGGVWGRWYYRQACVSTRVLASPAQRHPSPHMLAAATGSPQEAS